MNEPIPTRAFADFPTSFAQRTFWLANEIEPGSPAYNLPRAIRIGGPLAVDILREALAVIVRRHDVLRTSFTTLDGELFQRVHGEAAIDVEVEDLSGLPEHEREHEALGIAAKLGQKSFDLEQAPLLRARLLRLGPADHVLVLVLHHIVTDGWSMGLFFDELAEIYGALTAGRRPDLPELALQYADYARWQHEHLTREALERDAAYWRDTLRGSPALLELPTDRPRPAVQSHHGSVCTFRIDGGTTSRLGALFAREGVTLFMGLLALFQVLLHRYTQQEDIPVGTPAAGRNDPDLAHLIGCFVNTLVIRGDLSGNPTFLELLQRVRTAALGAYAHQDLPFEQLVAELHPERTRSYAPLFQVMFILQNAKKQMPRLPGLELQELELDSGLAKFDLTLEVIEQDGLYCQLEYSTDLFEAATIERMARHFQNLVRSVLDSPASPIGKLPMLDEAERRQILFDWNETAAGYSRDLTIGRAFEEQVCRTPEAVALREGERTITYGELDRRANQVAHALAQRGGPETPIGVYLPRSIEAFMALLGVLKAGAPYVPLDTTQPQHRLHLLIEQAGCRTVVTQRACRSELPDTVEAILVDPDASLWTSEPDDTAPAVQPGEVAYIIFTSGSTGTPKGVMGTHRATMNRFEWMNRTYPFAPDEVCCQKTALGFVDSVWEMFGPLLSGIPSVIIPDDVVIDPPRLLDLLAAERVTRLVLVPTLLRVLLDYDPELGARLPRLKFWSVSGEYLPADLARRFGQACPDAELINIYGSSEVAADVTHYPVGEARGLTAVPIGKPISNCQVYLLDRFGEPVPIGVPATIHVGGECLSLGYWRRPDLTEERFIPNPVAGAPSPRLFNTGDRGRYRPDGNIEYLGRLDNQTKLRGIRIELGEIEADLVAHPLVAEAAVTISGSTSENQQLVAYVVGLNGTAPSSDELRRFLRGRLPAYMVPGLFMAMTTLPLLPSGKVDRRALPQPAAGQALEQPRRTAPSNADESTLLAIWRELLPGTEIGTEENFFDLGGNSLLAMQVIARIRKQFNVEVSVRSLFDAPTIAALAKEVDRARASGAVARPEIRPRGRTSPDIEALSAELMKLSPEQIEALLQSVRQGGGS